ncbi:MAG: hypothetical protein PHN88_08060 [Ignavibacteria bacterium]|nr:hypothetical protein [Ignavibacteria bacterium]
MKSKKLVLLFFAVSIFISESSFSQGWIDNNITGYFKDYYVKDHCFSNDVLWAITETTEHYIVEVVKCDNGLMTRYYINHINNGKLEHFLRETKFSDIGKDCFFTPSLIKCTKEKVWLIDERDMIIAMIQNDSIWFDKCNFTEQKKIGNLYYTVDSNNLYLLNRYDMDRNRFTSNGHKLFSFGDEKKIIQREMTLKIDSIYAVTDFFINCDRKVFLVSNMNEKIYCNFYIIGKNDSLLKIIGPFVNEFLCTYFLDNKTIYLIIENDNDHLSNFVAIDSNLNYFIYDIPKINSRKFEGCSSFVVFNNAAYIADANGFYKYEYLNGQIATIKQKPEGGKESDFFENSIRKLKIKDGIIYGVYSGYIDFMRCPYISSPGIYLYKPEK